jgi:DNA mismatch repair protein MSH6
VLSTAGFLLLHRVRHPLTPTPQAKKPVSYAESSDEDDEDVFTSLNAKRSRQGRRRAAVLDEDDEEDFKVDEAEAGRDDDGRS